MEIYAKISQNNNSYVELNKFFFFFNFKNIQTYTEKNIFITNVKIEKNEQIEKKIRRESCIERIVYTRYDGDLLNSVFASLGWGPEAIVKLACPRLISRGIWPTLEIEPRSPN